MEEQLSRLRSRSKQVALVAESRDALHVCKQTDHVTAVSMQMVATVNSAAATKGMAPVSLGAEQPSPEDWKRLDESLYLKLPNRLNEQCKNNAFCPSTDTRLSVLAMM